MRYAFILLLLLFTDGYKEKELTVEERGGSLRHHQLLHPLPSSCPGPATKEQKRCIILALVCLLYIHLYITHSFVTFVEFRSSFLIAVRSGRGPPLQGNIAEIRTRGRLTAARRATEPALKVLSSEMDQAESRLIR